MQTAHEQRTTSESSLPALPAQGGERAAASLPALGRYHGLDLLRACMMSLGVVLHVAINYQQSPADGAWPYRDPNPSPLAGLLVLGIHAFRMPAFFLLAGFFAAMMFSRSGSWGFAKGRLQRIALPMVVGWALLFPVVKFGFVFGAILSNGKSLTPALSEAATIIFANPWGNPTPIHLWFLYYLLVYSALALVIVTTARLVPATVRGWASSTAGELLNGRLRYARVPVLALLTWLTLLPMNSPVIDTPGTFILSPRVFCCYGVFFIVGWLMFNHRRMIDDLRTRAWRRLMFGVAALGVYIVLAVAWFVAGSSNQPPGGAGMLGLRAGALAALAVAVWLLILGAIGVVERMVQRPNRAIRFVVDSSYWVYLAHLPLCVIIPALMRDWNAPGVVKMAAAMLLVLAIVLVVYQALCEVLPRRVKG